MRIEQGDFVLTADFSIPTGARVAVLGPSGAGKSTFLSVIAGFLDPIKGQICWQGQDITKLAPGDRPLSILFQDGNLFPHLTVEENLGLGLNPTLRLTPSQRQSLAEALEQVGLAGKAKRLPSELSGGEQSRVALARALLRARPILLLDEPFAALGPALKAQMLDLVETIVERANITVLMVSHDPEDARRLCPLSVVVAEGQVQPPHPTEDLLRNPPAALRAYLGT